MTQNTMQSQKSNLAKLLATENIQVLQNQVKTASFDVKDRVLTIPFFQHNDNNVIDMLIAHEVSHALHTPSKSWQDMKDRSDEFRSFVNVLEDTRIDKLIQKKYPGVVQNYLKGFDSLLKENFFGTKDRNLNDYSLIDRINLWYKSSKTLPITFKPKEKVFINAIEKLKTFKDVLKLAEDILGYCKEELKNAKSETVEIYTPIAEEGEKTNSDTEQTESKDVNDKLDAWVNKNIEVKDKSEKDKLTKTGQTGNGANGTTKLTAVTNEVFTDPKLFNLEKSSRAYAKLNQVYLKNLIIPTAKFISDNQKAYLETGKKWPSYKLGLQECEKKFTEFKNKSIPVVNYLVKEFEMRKNARLHARASNDKTGVIDPLKLYSYKFAEDIFKRITVVPNEKNHGMIFLLDWSGSMSNHLMPTVEQLLNLVWFVKKVNIPFSVYAFVNNNNEINSKNEPFSKNNGELMVDQTTKLIQLFTHKLTKTQMLMSAKTLYTMAAYYTNRYTRHDIFGSPHTEVPSPHGDYQLSSTPLDESLIAMDKIIAMFKDQNKVDKTVLVCLTDGGANSLNGVVGSLGKEIHIKLGKNYVECNRWAITKELLTYLKKKHNIKTVGFYLVNNFKRLQHRIWHRPVNQIDKIKSIFNKEKVFADRESGYDVYYYVKSDLKVESSDLDKLTVDSKKSEIKRMFAKSMKGRLISRVLLQKFIKEVA
jgi:hypothetical protein